MSYESELNLNQNRASRFINPTQLAFILSLVLHLLIYKFGLPRFHLNSDSGKREVSIVQLTPEQQSRLPNLYPEPSIPENLPENIPLDSDPAAPPYAFTPNIGFPNLPPVAIPPPPNFDIPSLPLPPVTDIKLPPIGDWSSLPLPPPMESLDTPVKPETTPKTKTPKQPETKPQAAKPPEATQPETKPQPKKEEEEKAKPQPSPQQIAVKKQQNLQKNVRSLSSSLQKKEGGTTNEDARKNYIYWLTKVNNIEPESLVIEGVYPRDACIRRLEGQSVYGAVVDPQGQVVALDLIKGAKYPIFNEQAVKDISTKALKNGTETVKPYQITVNYKYDAEICPSLTLPSLRRDNQPKQETPKPAPATPPKPEAETPKPAPATPPKPEAETPKPAPATPPKPEAETPKPAPATPTKPEAETPKPAPATPPKPEAETPKPAPATPTKPEAETPKPAPATPPKPEAETPKPAPATPPKPEAETPKPAPATPTKPEAETPKPAPATPPKPSLKDRLRDVPLPDRKPSDLKDTQLPETPRL
jgi:outer membrane biosynthesis protein TonB